MLQPPPPPALAPPRLARAAPATARPGLHSLQACGPGHNPGLAPPSRPNPDRGGPKTGSLSRPAVRVSSSRGPSGWGTWPRWGPAWWRTRALSSSTIANGGSTAFALTRQRWLRSRLLLAWKRRGSAQVGYCRNHTEYACATNVCKKENQEGVVVCIISFSWLY